MTRWAKRFFVEAACGVAAVYLALAVFGLLEHCAGCSGVAYMTGDEVLWECK